MLVMCRSTPATVTTICSAIPAFERPSAIKDSTSRSRLVNLLRGLFKRLRPTAWPMVWPGNEVVPEWVVAATLESAAPKNRVKEANRRMRVARHPRSEEHKSFLTGSFERGCARR
jgi:hypothetical protein